VNKIRKGQHDRATETSLPAQGDKRGDIQVWIVDGGYVRGHIDEEFTNFGQHYRYAYIPKNEFWIDEEAEHDEQAFFIDHLLVEHQLMGKGRHMQQPSSKPTRWSAKNAAVPVMLRRRRATTAAPGWQCRT